MNSKLNQFKNIQELQELGEYSNNFPPTPELEKITFYPNYPVGPRGRNSLEPQIAIRRFTLFYAQRRIAFLWIVPYFGRLALETSF